MFEISGCSSGDSKGIEKWLLSFIQPHKEVCSSTISRWLKDTLVLSGVTKVLDFRGHPTRSASISTAELSGLSVKEVLDQGSRSNESTWQMSYHKENIREARIIRKTFLRNRRLSTERFTTIEFKKKTVNMT